MTTMLEKARAASKREINRLRKVRVPEYPGAWKMHEGLGWENIDDVVDATIRAVLMAVREPGIDMTDDIMSNFADPCWPEDAKLGFTAMIDAILNEDPAA